jgi:hypothetical protein
MEQTMNRGDNVAEAFGDVADAEWIDPLGRSVRAWRVDEGGYGVRVPFLDLEVPFLRG